MVEKESPRNIEVREYYMAEEKTPLRRLWVMLFGHGGLERLWYENGLNDLEEAIKRPSHGMIWQFEKSTEDNTFYQSRNPALPARSDKTFWEKNDISKRMVMTALDACKETYVGSYSKPPHEPLSDQEWLAGESERDPCKTAGMSKSCTGLSKRKGPIFFPFRQIRCALAGQSAGQQLRRGIQTGGLFFCTTLYLLLF